MQQSKKFGLIGKNISYSFSKKYFTDKFHRLMLPYTYEFFDIEDISMVKDIFSEKNLVGLNVTTPYKEIIIPFLDDLSEEAKNIGAVNTIYINDGLVTGYNTDATGFQKSLLLQKKDLHNSALVLGNGGAAKAVQFVLDQLNIPHQTVSRSGNITFENLTKDMVAEHKIIVQCTPVGTFPNTEDSLPFHFDALTDEHLVIDLIYNPNYTQFIKNAALYGAKTMNGLYMLEQQAEKSWQIWNS